MCPSLIWWRGLSPRKCKRKSCRSKYVSRLPLPTSADSDRPLADAGLPDRHALPRRQAVPRRRHPHPALSPSLRRARPRGKRILVVFSPETFRFCGPSPSHCRSQRSCNFAFALTYAHAADRTALDMFEHQHGSPEFQHFLDLLGERVCPARKLDLAILTRRAPHR